MRVISAATPALHQAWCAAETGSVEYAAGFAHMVHVKHAAEAPALSRDLVGQLYLSSSGWLLMRVPNALGRGAFDALDEEGVELPTNDAGQYNAHVSVMRPAEIEKIGGPDKITERGHMYHYTLGPLKTCKPGGWEDVSRVWFIDVDSPELERLRASYGLSRLPNEDKYRFHITIAIRKSRVLQRGDVTKV